MKILNYDTYINVLNEKLITFNKQVYPKYDNVVVLCGGGGSGKSYVIDNVLGVDAKPLSTDDILKRLTKFEDDTELSKKYKNMYGKKLSEVDFGNPEDCENLHNFINGEKIANKEYHQMFSDIFKRTYKPNIIFDVTLKNYPKIEDISGLCMIGGYKKENIHLVWVLNSFDTAKEQNAKRDRKVPEDGILQSHKGSANVMRKLISKSSSMGMIDGDVWIYFGSTNTGDTELVNSANGGKYIEDFCAVKIKESGKPFEDYNTIMNQEVSVFDVNHNFIKKIKIKDKINMYTPNETEKF